MDRISYSTENEHEVYKAMLTALPQSMFLLDKNKNIIGIFNAAPETLAGVKVEEIVGTNIVTYANDPDSPFFQACSMLNSTFGPVFKTGVPLKFQYMILDTYLEATITKISGERILSQVRDISDIVLKQQEIERKKHLELSMALTAGGLTSWSYDVKVGLLSSQQANEVIGDQMLLTDLLQKIEPEYRQLTQEMFADILYKGKKHAHVTVPVLNKNGTKQWADVHAIPYEYEADGSVVLIVGSQKDVTKEYEDHKRLCDLVLQNEQTMQELSQAKERAEQSDRLKSAFLANMSHEIRTPLNSIVGFAELIPESEGEEQQSYIQLINSNSEVLLQLINDILDLSKIEAGYFTCNNTIFDLSDLFQELQMNFQFKKLAQVDLYCRLPQQPVSVNLDRVRVSQVIINFVTNAIKFTKEGHICMGYEVLERDWIRIFVEDTGIGMREDEVRRVFERFEKFNSFAQGTGLGTSIAKAIVDAYGGKVGASSVFGQGSTFWAIFPVNTDVGGVSIPIPTSLRIHSREDENKRSVSPVRLLVAEDNESNYILIKALLKGYDLVRACNGQEAVELAVEQSFTMILMDIQMPIMDGLDAIRRIRQFNPTIPIIAVTANAFDEDRNRAMAAGADDYITKPLSKNNLLSVIGRLI